MKISATTAASLLLVASASAFTPNAPRAFVPATSSVFQRDVVLFMAEEKKVPFFASGDSAPAAKGDSSSAEKDLDAMSVEEEIEQLTQSEMGKLKRASNLRNSNGVDYAPWMKISSDDEAKIRQVMKEKAEVRRMRQMQEKTVSGALLVDSQAQELSGGGLQTKVIDNGEGGIELEWTTSAEGNTKGFLIKRRAARTEEFEVIASFEDWGPLASKGPDGGMYRFLDEDVSPGGYVYRVTECEVNGKQNDICQALVEVQTPEEQRGAVIAAASIAALAVLAVAAGVLLDPVGGF